MRGDRAMSMTNEEAIERAKTMRWEHATNKDNPDHEAMTMAIKALEKKPIDKSAMMSDIYMEGINMAGEYQGCWVRFKDIAKIVDKYIAKSEE